MAMMYANGQTRSTASGCDYVRAARGTCCAEHRSERSAIERNSVEIRAQLAAVRRGELAYAGEQRSGRPSAIPAHDCRSQDERDLDAAIAALRAELGEDGAL